MSEPIQSISQGNYILHNIDAKKLYVQEPLFTANSGDAVYVGWRPDETVLWSGVSSISANPTFAIPESFDNFERVKIYMRGYPTHQAQLAAEWCNDNSSEHQLWGIVPAGGANGAALRFNRFAISANDTTCKVYSARQFSLQGTAASTATSPSELIRIIGINRKENA